MKTPVSDMQSPTVVNIWVVFAMRMGNALATGDAGALWIPQLLGHRVAIAPVEQFKSKIISKIISNSVSWIGLTKQHIDRIQNVQDNYFKKVFKVAHPYALVKLDSQTIQVKWQSLLKTMVKDDNKFCKRVLIAGQ